MCFWGFFAMFLFFMGFFVCFLSNKKLQYNEERNRNPGETVACESQKEVGPGQVKVEYDHRPPVTDTKIESR